MPADREFRYGPFFSTSESITIMKSHLIILAIIAAISSGCGKSEKSSVLQVLKIDNAVSHKYIGGLPAKSSNRQAAAAIGAYCGEMEKLDLSDCPADFRVAVRNHLNAWREAQAAFQQLPDGFTEGLLMGAFNGALGEADGGQSRLQGALQQAQLRIRNTYEEVEKIGAKYGAAL